MSIFFFNFLRNLGILELHECLFSLMNQLEWSSLDLRDLIIYLHVPEVGEHTVRGKSFSQLEAWTCGEFAA